MASLLFKTAFLSALVGSLFGMVAFGGFGTLVGMMFGGILGLLFGSFQKEAIRKNTRKITELERKVEELEEKE